MTKVYITTTSGNLYETEMEVVCGEGVSELEAIAEGIANVNTLKVTSAELVPFAQEPDVAYIFTRNIEYVTVMDEE